MYNALLLTHSYLRYFVLATLMLVVLMSLIGLLSKRPFGKADNLSSLLLLIFTHLQVVVGLLLYFVSPFVQFGSNTMKDHVTRYWTVEHGFAMLIAVVLITMARITAKKMSSHPAKFKRLFIFNLIALVIVVGTIALSQRGIL